MFHFLDTTRKPRPGEENGKGTSFTSSFYIQHLLFSPFRYLLYVFFPSSFRLSLRYTRGDADRHQQRRVHRTCRVFREHVRDEQSCRASRPGQEPHLYTWYRHAGCEEHQKDRPQPSLHLHSAAIRGNTGEVQFKLLLSVKFFWMFLNAPCGFVVSGKTFKRQKNRVGGEPPEAFKRSQSGDRV